MHPALCRMDQFQAGWGQPSPVSGQSPGHRPHHHQQSCLRAVLSTWHLLQLYLCGSESALSSELSSFSSEEIPILPMNSSRWWSSISAMSCRTVTNPTFTAVHWGIICLPSELYLCPFGWRWVWPSCGTGNPTYAQAESWRTPRRCSMLWATLCSALGL